MVIESDGETSEVKTVTDTTFMLLPLADKSEYFSDPTFCTARSRDDAKDSGITSATEPLSGRTEILPFVEPFWMIVPDILGVWARSLIGPWMMLTVPLVFLYLQSLILLRWKGLELSHLEQLPLFIVAALCLYLIKLGELVADIALIPWLFVFPGNTMFGGI